MTHSANVPVSLPSQLHRTVACPALTWRAAALIDTILTIGYHTHSEAVQANSAFLHAIDLPHKVTWRTKMNATKTTTLAAVAGLAALMMTGGAFAKTFEAIYTVSIHSRATTASKVVDKLFEGERVKIRTCDDTWCFITHEGPDGWVPVASLESLGGYDGAPTIVFEGGFNFPHPPKPPIVVDPGPKKPPFHPIVGQLPIGGLLPVNGGGSTGGSSGGSSGGHGPVCLIGHPCLQQP